MYFIIAYALAIITLFVVGLVLVNSLKTRGSIARALNMSLFLITLPKETATGNIFGQQPQRPEKELISIMEQLYSAFTNLHAKGWNKFIYGEPYIALEMSVHHVGEEIHFYMAVPNSYEDSFKKQAHGLYPNAEIEHVRDYNIFNKDGVSAGAYIKLKENPILPIKTYQNLEADPLGGLATALSSLQHEGEGAAIQILIRPAHQGGLRRLAQKVAKEMQSGLNFKKALIKAKKPPKKKDDDRNEKLEEPRVITPFEGEIVKAIQSKAVKPLFDTNIRLVVSSGSDTRSNQLLNSMGEAFVQFTANEMNEFKLSRVTSRALDKLLFNFSFRLFNNSHQSILSSEEVSSLYHFPLHTTLVPKVKFLKAKSAEPPPNLPSEGVVLGKNLFRGTENIIRMTRGDRRRHLYTLGQTGTGKTTLMENLIYQDIANGDGVAFIDPHGTAVDRILGFIPKERHNDVIVFDPSDVSKSLGLNMLEFDPHYPEQKTFIVNELLSIFQKLFLAETMGPMFDQYFRNAALLLLDDYVNEVPTLINIPRVLTDEVYRRDKLSRETNPIVKNFWEKEAEKAGGEAALANMAPYITSKINGFIANEYLRPILSQKKSAFNFRELMDDKKILLVNLSKGRIGDINANLLGMIIVGKILMAALSRVDVQDESQRPDFYLYIDEFQNFTTDSISTILAEARKYHLNLIIANQFIKQLQDKIRDSVFGNVGSMAIFRVGSDDAEYLKNQFEQVFSAQDLVNIDNFNCYLKLLINNQTSRPFNIKLDWMRDSDINLAHELKQKSRLKYGGVH
jgi:hypothetical protein